MLKLGWKAAQRTIVRWKENWAAQKETAPIRLHWSVVIKANLDLLGKYLVHHHKLEWRLSPVWILLLSKMKNLWKAVPKDSRGNSVPELPKLTNKCGANPFLVEEHPSRDLWTLMSLTLLVFPPPRSWNLGYEVKQIQLVYVVYWPIRIDACHLRCYGLDCLNCF